MKNRKMAPYGSWLSCITPDLIATNTTGLGQIFLDGDVVYWVESRPEEAGRNVVVRRLPDGKVEDVTPQPFNVRTRVHEYGGGAFLVDRGTVYFSNFSDQRLYRQEHGNEPAAITPEGDLRYADGIMDARRNRIICVYEDHTGKEVINTLTAIRLDGRNIPSQTRKPVPGSFSDRELKHETQTCLISGHDFYSSPRLSPDGTRLVWLTWNLPDMPWDSTELWIGKVAEDGVITDRQKVAGGPEESICQPKFSPDSVLYFVSDRTGWWNIYRWKDGQAEAIWESEAEFGVPQWIFGSSNYGFVSASRIVSSYLKGGISFLASIDIAAGEIRPIETPFTAVDSLQVSNNSVYFIGASPSESISLVRLDLESGQWEISRPSSDESFTPGYLSIPEEIEFPTGKGLSAHAFFYRPQNEDFAAPAGERPPLIVISHGGPTSAATSAFNLTIQYWTSRGFALVNVNYGGSTGYGRVYRHRLNGNWGIVDVDDCINAARYLIGKGDADPERTIIRGGSAGGYTALAALTFRNFFKAGASYYGVSDLEALEKDTHKFESRYSNSLIGPYPERADLYQERSPINYVDKLSAPVIFFQGDEDRVVPPAQSQLMIEGLRRKGIPVAYLLFEHE